MKYFAPLLISVSLLLASCARMKVTSETQSNYDFKSVKTYTWMPAPEDILNEDDTYINKNVEQALDTEFRQRGWKSVDTNGSADLHIVYYIKLAEQTEYAGGVEDTGQNPVVGGFTYNKNDDNWSAKKEEPNLSVYTVEIGTLILLIYDENSGDLLWRGTLKARLDRNIPLEDQKELLQKIARKLTRKIPGR